ncbi:hypothetical protein FRB90_006997 [Tulasnella sp. 427]|nr:hypothetical protein FRB90_006997 [Tulasnella sp. 427]
MRYASRLAAHVVLNESDGGVMTPRQLTAAINNRFPDQNEVQLGTVRQFLSRFLDFEHLPGDGGSSGDGHLWYLTGRIGVCKYKATRSRLSDTSESPAAQSPEPSEDHVQSPPQATISLAPVTSTHIATAPVIVEGVSSPSSAGSTRSVRGVQTEPSQSGRSNSHFFHPYRAPAQTEIPTEAFEVSYPDNELPDPYAFLTLDNLFLGFNLDFTVEQLVQILSEGHDMIAQHAAEDVVTAAEADFLSQFFDFDRFESDQLQRGC